jgi:hypothetical protein
MLAIETVFVAEKMSVSVEEKLVGRIPPPFYV